MNSRGIRLNTSKRIALFVTLGLVTIINGWFFLQAQQELNDHEEEIQATLEQLYVLQQLEGSVLETESSQRNFIIIGESSYLAPYEKARQDTLNAIEELSAMTPASTEISEQYALLRELITRRLAELADTLELITQNEDENNSEGGIKSESQKVIQHLKSENQFGLMQQVHLVSKNIETLLNGKSELSHLKARQNRSKQFVSILIATCTSLFFIGLTLYFVERNLRQQQNLTEQLEEANKSLEEKVQQRTRDLEKASLELQRSNRELEDFAFVASHDLQEPLRKIRAFGDRLEKKYADKLGDGADYIDRMQSAAARMSKLIEDLLSFSRITTHAKPFTSLDLNSILDDVLDDLGEAIIEKKVVVRRDKLPPIKGDSTQLHQILLNIIGNAIKFSLPERPPEIYVSNEIVNQKTAADDQMSDKQLELKISDNGIGFDPQFSDRIFTPFQRLHNKEQYPGNGIGLAVCRRIAERHGGSIRAESQLNEGTTFIIRLALDPQIPIHKPKTMTEPAGQEKGSSVKDEMTT